MLHHNPPLSLYATLSFTLTRTSLPLAVHMIFKSNFAESWAEGETRCCKLTVRLR